MQRLKHAFRFIQASFKLAFTHPHLMNSWLTLGIGGLLLVSLWFIPLALIISLIGLTPIGLTLIGILCVFAAASLMIWGEITTLDLYPKAAELFQESAREFPNAPKPIRTHWKDILQFVLALPGAAILNLLRKRTPETAVADWFNARTLIPAVISIENQPLPQSVARVEQMLKENLIRFQPNLMRVRLIAWFVQWLFLIGSTALGVYIAISIADPAAAGIWQQLLAMGVGMLPAWLLTTLGVMFSTFTRTCYHASLYIWVRRVEDTHKGSKSDKASPPEILRQVLGVMKESK